MEQAILIICWLGMERHNNNNNNNNKIINGVIFQPNRLGFFTP